MQMGRDIIHPSISKYILRRYLDPPNPPQSHFLRRYDWSPRECLDVLDVFMTIEWFGIVNFQPARATVGEDENGRTFVAT